MATRNPKATTRAWFARHLRKAPLIGLIAGWGGLLVALTCLVLAGLRSNSEADRELAKGVLPAIGIMWTMVLPYIGYRITVAHRETEQRQIHETAWEMAKLAAYEIDGVQQGYWRFAEGIDEGVPSPRFKDFREALGAFKPDKLPNARALVALEQLRSVLSRCDEVLVRSSTTFGGRTLAIPDDAGWDGSSLQMVVERLRTLHSSATIL